MELEAPFYPIIYVRGFAATRSEIENTVATPYMGFNLGSTKIRQNHQGKPVKLTFTEFRILHFLARRPGWVYTRYQIIDAVQGEDHIVTDRSVDVQIVGLRKKLGPAGKHIETVRGIGYRFKE